MSERPLPEMSPRALPLVVTRWKCPHFQPADTENYDCIPGCTITIPEGCNQGQRLPDQRPIIGCPVWEPVDQA